MSVIGLDIGTSRVKALLFDGEVATGVVGVPTPVVTTGIGDLRDAGPLLDSVVHCLRQLVAELTPDQRSQIAGIGVTSLSEEVVLLDGSHMPVMPMPCWYTEVSRREAQEVGLEPSLSWSKMRWAAAHASPQQRERVRAWTTLCSYISGMLSGGSRFPVDTSHASRTGFFDVIGGNWDEGRFRETGWELALPALVPAGTSIGPVASGLATELRLDPGVQVVLAGHDHFCGAFAAGVRGPGQLFLSAGTSVAHALIVGDPPSRSVSEGVHVGRFVDGRSFYLHAQLPSGHLYAHLRALIGDRWEELEHAGLEVPAGSDGIRVTPSAGAVPEYRVTGITLSSSPASFVRAFAEGTAWAAREIDETLQELAGEHVASVVVAGEATRSPLWRQVRASLSRVPLERVADTELTALGAAHLCWESLYGAPPAGVAREVIPPDPEKAVGYCQFRRSEDDVTVWGGTS